ncbi:hypothetical protein, partial [Lactiplantibacillus pentosus]
RDKVEVPKVITPYSWLELTTTIVRDCFGPFFIFVRINYRICHTSLYSGGKKLYKLENRLC